MICKQFDVYNDEHINDNSSQHRIADYWAGDNLWELKLYQQWHHVTSENVTETRFIKLDISRINYVIKTDELQNYTR